MRRGPSRSIVGGLIGAVVLALTATACGSGAKSSHAVTHPRVTHTHTVGSMTSGGTTTSGAATGTSTTATTSGSGGAPATTSSTSTTTTTSGGGASGGAGLGGTTKTTQTTTTTTSSTSTACKGRDCAGGSPTVPGSVAPVDGKCSAGYVYVGAQDGGPALCVPRQTSTITTNTTPQ